MTPPHGPLQFRVREQRGMALQVPNQRHEVRPELLDDLARGLQSRRIVGVAVIDAVGLDVLVSRALLDTVAELRDKGKCIVYSTHTMREAERLCDQVAIMYEGNILAEGTLEGLLSTYGEEDLEELFFGLITRHREAKQTGTEIRTSTD